MAQELNDVLLELGFRVSKIPLRRRRRTKNTTFLEKVVDEKNKKKIFFWKRNDMKKL
jgi:hypothetical protein